MGISGYEMLMTLLVLAGVTSGYSDHKESGSSSKVNVSIYEHPYMADLDGCSGAIVSSEWILTAAHCAYDKFTGRPKRHQVVRVGSDVGDRGRRAYVESSVEHPKFDLYNALQYDFLLLKLSKPLAFGKRVGPVKLAGSHGTELRAGTRVQAYGFGHMENESIDDLHYTPKRLLQENLQIISTDECIESFDDIDHFGGTICAKSDQVKTTLSAWRRSYESSCGDTGGPLVVDGALVGVAATVAERECAPSNPRIFAPVPAVRNWIRYHITKNSGSLTTTAPSTEGYWNSISTTYDISTDTF